MRLEARLPPAMRRPFLSGASVCGQPTQLRQWKERLMDVGSGVTARRLEVRALHLEKAVDFSVHGGPSDTEYRK